MTFNPTSPDTPTPTTIDSGNHFDAWLPVNEPVHGSRYFRTRGDVRANVCPKRPPADDRSVLEVEQGSHPTHRVASICRCKFARG